MIYEDDFASELQDKTPSQKNAMRAAILKIINDIKKEVQFATSNNTLKASTKEFNIGIEPVIVLQQSSSRRVAWIQNQGEIAVKMFAVNTDANGSFILYPKKKVDFRGCNPLALATVSGFSQVGILDS